MANIDGLLSATSSDRAELIGRMMTRLDVDLTAAGRHTDGTTLADAARRCMQCRQVPACRAYLDRAPLPGCETIDSFCPNAGVLAMLAHPGAEPVDRR